MGNDDLKKRELQPQDEELLEYNQELNEENAKSELYRKKLFHLVFFLFAVVIFSLIVWALVSKGNNYINSLTAKSTQEKTAQNDADALLNEMTKVRQQMSETEPVEEDSTSDVDIDDLLGSDDSTGDKPAAPAKPAAPSAPKPPSQAYLDKITPTLNNPKLASEDKQAPHLSAYRQNLNPDYLLPQSTVIKCNLMNDVVSTMESDTKCLVTKNVFSANGKRVLVPSGSIASGASLAGMVKGQRKMFITWDRLLTPEGVVIPLESSQSIDKTGELGHQASVKSNFLVRFGNALMISVLSTAVNTGFENIVPATIHNDENNTKNKVNIDVSDAKNSMDMSLETLKNEIDIQPVGQIKRGTIVNILVSQDIDFSEAVN
ncbi:MAG: TrbI/VirB10 family protein [Neisseriaceae bacterium]